MPVMGDAPPRDPAIDELATARALITMLQDQVTTLQRENASLRHQLDVLCQRMFGKKSERVDPRRLQLALEQLANESGPVRPIEMDSRETRVRGHPRRRPTAGGPCGRTCPAAVSRSTCPTARNSARAAR
jgi:hypothetical protein